jgi:hypothetical protein
MAQHTFSGTVGLRSGESPVDIARKLGLPLTNPQRFKVNHGHWGIVFDFGRALTTGQRTALRRMAAARGWGEEE